VEGADPGLLGETADKRLHPLAHLFGCFVGEGDGKHRARRDSALLDQVSDPVRDNPGLAAAGSREDQKRTLAVDNRLALLLVKIGQQFHRIGSMLAHGNSVNSACLCRII